VLSLDTDRAQPALILAAAPSNDKWGPNRGDNPAPVNPGAIGGSSQGTSNLWNAMCDTVWSILIIVPAFLLHAYPRSPIESQPSPVGGEFSML
jgi:hypothetical protein